MSPDGGAQADDATEGWAEAKQQALDLLISVARERQTISYSKFVPWIRAIPDLKYHDDERLDRLLTELSLQEAQEGRGLISVLVVNMVFPGYPSDGFWEIAVPRYAKGTNRSEIFTIERDKVWDAHRLSAN